MITRLCLVLMSAALMAPFLAAESGQERANRLLEAMGGREAWQKVELLIVEATHHRIPAPTSYSNRIVNDLTQPRVIFESHAPGIARWTLIEGETGRIRRDDDPITEASPERVERELGWWDSNIYRTLRRIAHNDPDLTLLAVEEDILEVHNGDGRLNWFRLNADGAPIMFGSGENEDGTIFGPLTDHSSGIRYPSWGAGDRGAWRYEIETFEVNPANEDLLFTIPEPPQGSK